MPSKIQLSGDDVISRIYAVDLEALPDELASDHLASLQPERNLSLANHLFHKVISKIKAHQRDGNKLGIYGAQWSRQHVREAAETHARIIIDAYGETYALPNKYPDENAKVIESGVVGFYFLALNGEFVGTACLSQQGDGRAELGRSAASRGRVGNGIIQDLRILEWLLIDEFSEKFHTLFTTIRTAPDRDIGLDRPMRGGQAVTSQWQKFPSLFVSGIAPLYFKHGSLEQFTIAQLSRVEYREVPLFIADETDRLFIENWHQFYGLNPIRQGATESKAVQPRVKVHAPPPDSDIFDLVHADFVFEPDARDDLRESVDRYFDLGSPFIQVVVPIVEDSIDIQHQLRGLGFQPFGYEPASNLRSAHLLFGKVKPGFNVVPTHWDAANEPHPYWKGELAKHARRIADGWPSIEDGLPV